MTAEAIVVPGFLGQHAAELSAEAGAIVAAAALTVAAAAIAVHRWRARKRLPSSRPEQESAAIASRPERETLAVLAGPAELAATLDTNSTPTVPVVCPSEPFTPSPAPVGAGNRGSRRAWLRSLHDSNEFLLAWESTRVGRAGDNDIIIDDLSVSRHHAVLLYDKEHWWLLPEVTGNGTFYNNRLVQPGEQIAIESGDLLRFGMAIELRFTTSLPLDRPEMPHFDAAARSTPGNRKGNEDVHLATEWVIAVADGVGGRKAGRVAARTAIQYVAQAEKAQSAAHSVAAAHEAIHTRASAEPLLSGMATTLDVARLRIVNGQVVIDGVHVGDGFAVILDESGPRLLTRPDTAGQRLEEADPKTARQMRDDPDYDRIVAAVGFAGPLRSQTWTVPALAGQRLLLSSDGLLAAVTYEQIFAVLVEYRDIPVDAVAEHLLHLGMQAQDNVTVVVADVDIDHTQIWHNSMQRPPELGSSVPPRLPELGSSDSHRDPVATTEEG